MCLSITPKLFPGLICPEIYSKYNNVFRDVLIIVRQLCIYYNFDCEMLLPEYLTHLDILADKETGLQHPIRKLMVHKSYPHMNQLRKIYNR
jgi:hypothetical protein